MKNRSAVNVFLPIVLAVWLCGCTVAWQELLTGNTTRGDGASSSIVDFLYPDGRVPPGLAETVPRLELPLRAGLAFVPSAQGVRPAGLTEERKQHLLETVKQRFVEYDFIGDIEIVPDTYLRTGGGFTNVEQVARLYSLDVICLVSYDQVGWVGDNWKSVTYWTIVGAYIFKGSEYDVSTFVDAAVFDVGSRKLLLRAPGTSVMKGAAAAATYDQTFRKAHQTGFDEAVAEMTENLDAELGRFRQRVEAGQEKVTITHRPGYTGGSGRFGSGDFTLLVSLLALVAHRRRRRRIA